MRNPLANITAIKDSTDWDLLTNANVKVTQHAVHSRSGTHNEATILVNDEHEWRFPATSRVSRALDTMTADALAERLNGGSYFFVGDKLVDFRDGRYNGFVHSLETIKHLMSIIGYHNQGQDNKPVLSNVWSKGDIAVPLYKEGGDFTSVLSFTWNPFVKNIDTLLEIVRLICSNGMTGLSSFLNTKIPLVNRWEEHLEIASRQIQNKTDRIVVNRIEHMGKERATVSDVLQLSDHVYARLEQAKSADAKNRLTNLASVLSTMRMKDVYKDIVFQDRGLAAQMPAHVTQFDAFNIATEIRSHTDENAKSSNFALDRFANAILIDRDANIKGHHDRFSQPKLSPFSDAKTAFFSEVE